MQVGLFPLVRVDEIEVDDANLLLERWEHPLGACHRPFGVQAHALALDMTGQGPRPIALTISASTVSETCGGDDRFDLVELARIARHPAEPWALRPMLRIWRQCLAQSWPHWTVSAAVSYALPGTPGHLYRFDGWERVDVALWALALRRGAGRHRVNVGAVLVAGDSMVVSCAIGRWVSSAPDVRRFVPRCRPDPRNGDARLMCRVRGFGSGSCGSDIRFMSGQSSQSCSHAVPERRGKWPRGRRGSRRVGASCAGPSPRNDPGVNPGARSTRAPVDADHGRQARIDG